ncbi:diaminopimelate decarboxylase [Mycolicibacterium mengxianglii]|uniref:diaminopimelate decarboxylase n=1 Tax=Mycolicibacterium mengxianglii TaxID=2736649 RepID=UPI0018D0F68E|nr:diaminopimelate decarboxylase [Mycolicibacterium mengxianglii]
MTSLDCEPSAATAPRPTPPLSPAIWPLTTETDASGRLCVGGVALTEIASRFGTPTYVLDEADVRFRIRRYGRVLPDVDLAYAGKALLTTAVARWAAEEHIGVDVCSPGELAVARAGGVKPARIIVHGNAKSFDDLHEAVTAGVGRIVIDSLTEIDHLTRLAFRPQSVLIRVTPGIDIHGHAAVTTGITDQKFGFPLGSLEAHEAITRVLAEPALTLVALHCHIGSQVTDATLYGETVRRMIAAMADIRERHDVLLKELNIGGGHGVAYVDTDTELDIDEVAAAVGEALESACTQHDYPRPQIVMEPGRALSARAGVTLYRVVAIKTQPGARTFVAVDGGMSDNPRVELYGAKYTVTLANRHSTAPTQAMTVAGRHCEAGDEIIRDAQLPNDLRPGDLLAVACTGAYHHSMASTYNVVDRPPLVGVNDGRTTELVRRETLTDLLDRDREWKQSSLGISCRRAGYAALLEGE